MSKLSLAGLWPAEAQYSDLFARMAERMVECVQAGIAVRTDEQFAAARKEWLAAERQRIFDGFVATHEQVLDNVVTREELELAGFEFDPWFNMWRRGFV